MKILVIGAGKMGEAIVKSWLLKNTKSKKKITIIDTSNKRRNILKKNYPGIEVRKEIPLLWKGDLTLSAVKPQSFLDISTVINSKKINSKMFLSIMAGVNLDSIEKFINLKTVFFRAMPNLAAGIGQGVTGVYAKAPVKEVYKKKMLKLLSSLGWVYWLKKEKFFNPLTAISGSGPAYIFLFVQIMINSSKKLGFSEKVSTQLVLQTIKGAIGILEKDNNIETLIKDVASPGGTTEAALEILTKKKPNLMAILNKAILAANERSKSLEANAKKS